MQLADHDLALLQRYWAERDHLQRIMGAATFEWQRTVLAATAKIERSVREEEMVGKSILRKLGLDPDVHDYEIDRDGTIKQRAIVDGVVQYIDPQTQIVVPERTLIRLG